MEAFIGTILPVGFNFAPRGWALCQGQLLSIAQNTPLFALLGTTYGGDGRTTFALPDLRGRTLVGMGNGPGLSPVEQGQPMGSDSSSFTASGTASVTIDAAHLPKHEHPVSIQGSQLSATSTLHATTASPGSAVPSEGAALGSSGGGPGLANIYVGNGAAPTVVLNSASVATKLSGQADAVTGPNNGTGAPIAVPVSVSASVSTMQPSLGINYIICLEGIFPSRE
ncbi:hypothetical protein B0920_15760 [Massilia sp. KIM]|uniref:phage tail protein n=1 Tax=Massilia sp. KIM TaxID=1955422 RepID=UPI00098FF306|nr:tail fiber protein [Massilia sp. KIM]OON60442.1 hypothetical protein B0920_15760 [Massilia sp. KIM]